MGVPSFELVGRRERPTGRLAARARNDVKSGHGGTLTPGRGAAHPTPKGEDRGWLRGNRTVVLWAVYAAWAASELGAESTGTGAAACTRLASTREM